MSIEGQGHFFTIYFPGFVCFVLYLKAKISGERLQDQWSSGLFFVLPILFHNKLGSEDEIKIKIKFIRTIFQLN